MFAPGRSLLLALIAAQSVYWGCRASKQPPPAPGPEAVQVPLPVEAFVRVRCATDGRDVFVTWRGAVHAEVPGDAPTRLFDVLGMSVARCARDREGWYLTTRELMLYLDPASGTPLGRWRDPWSGAERTVMHVANDPVQARLPASIKAQREGDVVRFVMEFNVSYPNPLWSEPRTRPYSPRRMYEAMEHFSLESPAAEVDGDGAVASAAMELEWKRHGPWLPWMDMGERPGRLTYAARGRKLAGFAELPRELRAVIDERLPVYRHAPRCYAAKRNVTSWSYFAEHLEAYQRGEQFPRPIRVADDGC